MLNSRKTGLSLFFVCFLSAGSLAPAYAANVSFMVVETGEGANSVSGTANIWEEGFLDAFFSAGYIVSNAQTAKIASFPEGELPALVINDFNEAKEGKSDYFIVVVLKYSSNSNTANAASAAPDSVAIKLYSVDPYKLITEKKITRKLDSSAINYKDKTGEAALSPEQGKEEFADAQKAAREIIPFLAGRKR